jgi:hypothetical protein
LVAHPKNTYDYNAFYRYMVASFVPSGQGTKVGDITFVYSREERYGVLIHDFVYDDKEPGIVVNEILTEMETKFIEDCLLSVHPIPQLHMRNQNLVKYDLEFLERNLGLVPWSPKKACKHFGYFFTLAELRKDPKKIIFEGPFEATYKYFGLDDTTAYIELCFCEK